ncbi:hypothetical protein EJ077_22005 [Mesorhizobium sp. M8A.F.Ca.ET.057.01.1.1]|nr:hypothetical protein EJ077_22005 [Mesorhizobium sp. M8A.F.Ca.ET.057.01.1.1]RUW54097.1 hypothetical protein EOA36_09505 [Mesorhizobium sp. M8A.F.Ca.ET.021.01.1.1]RUX06688.1 hypothetical protein EOA30_09920 [Mesorhizobium sp. M8A.F.Ca.ET.059.01.1.1]RWE40376.1 MAG: hypothetical protein EOS80_30800 [Mesorhizobium sp.]TGP85927.1 hypothetical protein EN861_32440 [Mesorhizobium sp. M8A.F.Ca.ET.218.01.1.1]TGT14837.1 hypothetical protein EN856_31980 [Mesorhizobium sp. M8A.F.Ca.ET.213.01.1.1]
MILSASSRTIAVSMVVARRKAIAGAPGPKRSGGRYGSDFVVARGMTAQPAGEESRDVPLRHRRPRRSRSSDQKHQSKRPLSVCSPRQDFIQESWRSWAPTLSGHRRHRWSRSFCHGLSVCSTKPVQHGKVTGAIDFGGLPDVAGRSRL